MRANAVDLTFEKYFGTKGYLALQLFYKDLKSYIYNQDVVIPSSELVLAPPPAGITIAPTATINIPTNGKGGELYGVELAGTLPFDTFSEALSGFGITGGVSYTETKILPTRVARPKTCRAIRSGSPTARCSSKRTASTSVARFAIGRPSSVKSRASRLTGSVAARAGNHHRRPDRL